MKRPGPEDVTVTIVNWNGREHLRACLEGLAALERAPARILVVDNASDDDSVSMVREHFPRVDVLELPENGGPCPARNAGLEAATTAWVLALDNDAVVRPDALERMLDAVAPNVVCVQPRAVFAEEPGRIHYDGARIHYAGIMRLWNYYRPVAEADPVPERIDAVVSFGLLLHRETALAVGAYDPIHFILFEDHDLSYRLRAAGHDIAHAPEAIVLHREGTAGISFRERGGYAARRVYLHSRNRWIVLLKCLRWRTLFLGGPGILVYEALYFGFALKEMALGAWFRGKFAALGLLPAILRARRAVQRSRVRPDRELLGAGPLTVSPLIERGDLIRRLQGAAEALMNLWWRIIRPLV
ncbi:MAG: glycosyltransferase family 2 protein [Planctomycetota bacterium]